MNIISERIVEFFDSHFENDFDKNKALSVLENAVNDFFVNHLWNPKLLINKEYYFANDTVKNAMCLIDDKVWIDNNIEKTTDNSFFAKFAKTADEVLIEFWPYKLWDESIYNNSWAFIEDRKWKESHIKSNTKYVPIDLSELFSEWSFNANIIESKLIDIFSRNKIKTIPLDESVIVELKDDENEKYTIDEFDEEWYDKYWYNKKWFNRNWVHKTTWTRFDPNWFDCEWYDFDWFNTDWIDRHWYDKRWFNRNWVHKTTWTRFDPNWFDCEWYDINWFDDQWYDHEWYDINWFNDKWIHKDTNTAYDPNWYDVDWFNVYWFDRDWYNLDWIDKDWYDRRWFDKKWIHKQTNSKYDPDWYDVYWFDVRLFSREWFHKETKWKYNARWFDYLWINKETNTKYDLNWRDIDWYDENSKDQYWNSRFSIQDLFKKWNVNWIIIDNNNKIKLDNESLFNLLMEKRKEIAYNAGKSTSWQIFKSLPVSSVRKIAEDRPKDEVSMMKYFWNNLRIFELFWKEFLSIINRS